MDSWPQYLSSANIDKILPSIVAMSTMELKAGLNAWRTDGRRSDFGAVRTAFAPVGTRAMTLDEQIRIMVSDGAVLGHWGGGISLGLVLVSVARKAKNEFAQHRSELS
jgi:hypothetical protein